MNEHNKSQPVHNKSNNEKFFFNDLWNLKYEKILYKYKKSVFITENVLRINILYNCYYIIHNRFIIYSAMCTIKKICC